MKPHFLPGDQVITMDKQVGEIVYGSQSTVTGNWSYLVTGPNGKFAAWEKELWHVNDTVARERAYARKGIHPPEQGDDQRRTAGIDADGNVRSLWGESTQTGDERADLSGAAVIHDEMAQEGQSSHALRVTDESGAPSGPLPLTLRDPGQDQPDGHDDPPVRDSVSD